MTITAPREHLPQALEADLIGPFDPLALKDEVLMLPPSRWYLMGFLAPSSGRELLEPTDDEIAAGPDGGRFCGPDADGGTWALAPPRAPRQMGHAFPIHAQFGCES